MKIVLDIPEDAFKLKQGALEQFRTQLVRLERAIETPRGHGKLLVRAYVYIFDRKKPWKFNRKATMAYRNIMRRAKIAA